MASTPFKVPAVSQDDIYAFHQAHFPQGAVHDFGAKFLPSGKFEDIQAPQEWADFAVEEEEDDGLGYYPDGVKRTLTDEQIAIFRHSEMEALRRSETRRAEKASSRVSLKSGDRDDGEIGEDGTNAQEDAQDTKKRKRKGKPKPDLRKRTWDVVEAGLDTLDYD